MTKRDALEFRPEPMAPAIVVSIFLLSALILSVGLWGVFGPDSPSEWTDEEWAEIQAGIHFPALKVDNARLEAARRAHYDSPDLGLVQDEVLQLHSLIRKANVNQFPVHDPSDRVDLQALDLQLRFAAEELLPVTGVRGFQRLGEPLFERCSGGVDALVRALGRGQIPLAQALEDPPANRFQAYREYCGNLLPVLVERNLVTTDGRWNHNYKDALIDILQRYRFADLIHSQFATRRQLSSYELEIFYRWTIEDRRAFDINERRRFLQRSESILPDSYDLALARARLDVADKDLASAVERFQELTEEYPSNRLYSAIYENLRRQSGQITYR